MTYRVYAVHYGTPKVVGHKEVDRVGIYFAGVMDGNDFLPVNQRIPEKVKRKG